MQKLLIAHIFLGLLSVALAIPLIAQKVKPNHWYGFRLPSTLKNPDVWYPVNRHAGWRLLFSAVLLLLTATVLYWVPGMNADTYAAVSMTAFLVPFTLGTLQTLLYLRKLKR